MSIGTWDLDLKTQVFRWSDHIAVLFGDSNGEIETSLEQFLLSVHPDDRQRVEDAMTDCLQQGRVYSLEHRCLWPDGTLRWLSQKGEVVRDLNGIPLRMVGVVQDVTERKLAEDKLLMMNGILQETASGEPIEAILSDIIQGVEQLIDGGICSLLVLEGNQLYSGADNRLPDFYNNAIDGLVMAMGWVRAGPLPSTTRVLWSRTFSNIRTGSRLRSWPSRQAWRPVGRNPSVRGMSRRSAPLRFTTQSRVRRASRNWL